MKFKVCRQNCVLIVYQTNLQKRLLLLKWHINQCSLSSTNTLRVYSHQESPLVHLLWSGPNTMLIFVLFGAVRFHTALFASEPETVNKTTRVLKVIHSLVHPFNRTRVRLEADRDHFFSWVSVRLFDPHPSVIAVFTPAQKIRTKGRN